jgi:hypothetical protein
MKKLASNLEELKNANIPEFYDKIYNGLLTYETDPEDLKQFLKDSFQYILGGDIFLVESSEDLSEIITPMVKYYDESPSYYTLKEKASHFDICEICGEFVHVLLCTHNGGGNTYLIPLDIANENPTVIESIELTRQGN